MMCNPFISRALSTSCHAYGANLALGSFTFLLCSNLILCIRFQSTHLVLSTYCYVSLLYTVSLFGGVKYSYVIPKKHTQIIIIISKEDRR